MEKLNPVFNQISLPAFSMVNDKPGTLQKHFLWLTRMLAIVFMPIFFGLSVVAPEVVPLILGEKWLAAVLPIQILCFVMPIRMVGLLFPSIITAVGRPEIMTCNMAVGCLVMPACFLFGSQLGAGDLLCLVIGLFTAVCFHGDPNVANIRDFLGDFSETLPIASCWCIGDGSRHDGA